MPEILTSPSKDSRGRPVRRAPWSVRPWSVALACLALAAPGCATVEPHAHTLVQDETPTDELIPTELCKVSLPAYRIAPPDILTIDMFKVVPKPPYTIEPLDQLTIQVPPTQTLPDQPVAGLFQVNSAGAVTLGPAYGSVAVEGMTLEEAAEEIKAHLENVIKLADVSVALATPAGKQSIAGEHLVAQDGRVNLGVYGRVYVTGLTVEEAKRAIEEHLANYLERPEVSVEVSGYNSQVYYVITQGLGASAGDGVTRISITGNETVLDALAQVNGLQQYSSKKVWIARPSPDNLGYDQILPVNWSAISQGGSTSTNYQVLPGDRIYIAENKVLAFTNFLQTVTGPFENAFGFTLLGVQTIQTVNRLPNGLRGAQGNNFF